MKPTRARGWRLWCAVLVCVALAVAAVAVLRPASPTVTIADRLAGERWYVVAFRHTPIGHFRTRNNRTAAGDFEFRTELRFKLGPGEQTRIEDRLVFHRRPPHRLLIAEHASFADDAPQRQIALGNGYAETTIGGQKQRKPADTDLTLAEYLTVERWLASAHRSEASDDAVVDAVEGDVVHASSVDFDRLAIVTQHWRVADAGETLPKNVEITKEDSGQTTRVVLDQNQVPLRMEIGNLFFMQRVADETAARIWEQSARLFAANGTQVPVNTHIANAEALQHLVLAVDHERDEAIWPGANATQLTAEADPRVPAKEEDIARASAITASFPADDSRVQALAARAVAGIDDQHAQADALTLFVHHHLRYHDSDGARTVYDTLRERRGDCTEFADLYTTLARAIGLPARTVVGLVYRADEQAFAAHAWNEVAIDQTWRGVDPTWGATRLDATHLRLPDDWALAALAQLPDIKFRVLEARY